MTAGKRWLEAASGTTKEALRMFSERGARLLSGSIAFYALVSVVPILVIALRVAGSFVNDAAASSAPEPCRTVLSVTRRGVGSCTVGSRYSPNCPTDTGASRGRADVTI